MVMLLSVRAALPPLFSVMFCTALVVLTF